MDLKIDLKKWPIFDFVQDITKSFKEAHLDEKIY